METNSEIVSRFTLGFRAVMVILWGGIAFYIAIDFPNIWFDESYSKTGLIIVGIPFLVLLLGGMYIPLFARIILTNEFIEVKYLFSKRVNFHQLKKIELGPNFVELHSEKNKKVVVSWIHENYDEIRFQLLEKANSIKGVSITQRHRYRKSW